MKQKKRHFGNELDEPDQTDYLAIIEAKRLGASDEKLLDDFYEEELRKVLLLCAHYRIKPSSKAWMDLALALARDFVPAFREANPSGPKEKWNLLVGGLLCAEVNQLIVPSNPNKGARWAASQLAKREPWISFLRKNTTELQEPNKAANGHAAASEALRKQYARFKDTPHAISATEVRRECNDAQWASIQAMAGIISR